MFREIDRRRIAVIAAILVAAASAGVTHAIAACPCATVNHPGYMPDTQYVGQCQGSIFSGVSNVEYARYDGRGQLMGYSEEIFGKWGQIDCPGTRHGADSCSITVMASVEDWNQMFVNTWTGVTNVSLCGNTCVEGYSPSAPSGSTHSQFDLFGIPGHTYDVTLKMCDGCSNVSGCQAASVLQTETMTITCQ